MIAFQSLRFENGQLFPLKIVWMRRIEKWVVILIWVHYKKFGLLWQHSLRQERKLSQLKTLVTTFNVVILDRGFTRQQWQHGISRHNMDGAQLSSVAGDHHCDDWKTCCHWNSSYSDNLKYRHNMVASSKLVTTTSRHCPKRLFPSHFH